MPDASITPPSVSANSRRVARNTVFLYFRMLLMMFIGLFTSRIVLKALGVDDYGIYGAVGGIVTMFTVITNSISQSISRYMTVGLGKGDSEKLKRVFSTAVIIQLLFCAAVVLLTETAGLWWLHSHMKIPAGRMGAAQWVLQCSMGVLMVNLLSVPFNATIVAHEKMGAYALISILEAVLKLVLVALLYFLGGDKLKIYAVLMLAVSLIVRLAYSTYCHHFFEESRGSLVFDRGLLREMTGFAGWNVMGSGAYLFNTQGVNLMSNWYFGVGVNAARLVAMQVENIVKQFVNNFLTAINPQITKSYVGGSRDYCFILVSKAVKFSCLVMLVFLIPLEFGTGPLLRLWLGDVPPHSVIFVRLMLLGLFADMAFNPLLTLIQADGRIRTYYIVSSLVGMLVFALSWVAFSRGAEPYVSYILFIAVYSLVDVIRLLTAWRLASFPVMDFLKDTLLPLLGAALISVASALLVWIFVDQSVLRVILILAAGWAGLAAGAWNLCLTRGEKMFIKSKVCR